ncbi:beta-1,3-galactosyltransferase 5-like [Branchiostoma floridae x Branchiostoma belcheri]
MVRVKVRLTLKTVVCLGIFAGFIYINWFQQNPHLSQTSNRNASEGNMTVNGSVRSNTNESAVISPYPYTYVINSPEKCSGGDVILVVMVTSSPGNHAQRRAIRQTWGNDTSIPGIRTLFAVGTTDKATTQRGLDHEGQAHQDIIQGNFIDSYRNLTLKTVMCLKWASEFCPGAKFFMKADDDTFVNIFTLLRHLRGLGSNTTERFVMGWIYNAGGKPKRTPGNKWYLSRQDYPRDTFPKYPCGFAYVISNDITGLLYQVSLTLKYLFLEDVFLGLCLEKLGGVTFAHDQRFKLWMEFPSCRSDKVLAAHWFKKEFSMLEAWRRVTSC